jgi:hypothetical protein
VQGVTACRVHGGTAGAIATAKRRDPAFRRSANGTAARAALAVIVREAIAAGDGGDGEGFLATARRIVTECQKI